MTSLEPQRNYSHTISPISFQRPTASPSNVQRSALVGRNRGILDDAVVSWCLVTNAANVVFCGQRGVSVANVVSSVANVMLVVFCDQHGVRGVL